MHKIFVSGVNEPCPVCRKSSPDSDSDLDKLFDLGFQKCFQVKAMIDQKRPGVAPETPWPPLSTAQQREMNQAVAMLTEAADQGHMEAQSRCAELFMCGRGVEKDDRRAFKYFEKAAQQGDMVSQHNVGSATKRCANNSHVKESRARLVQQSSQESNFSRGTPVSGGHQTVGRTRCPAEHQKSR